MRVSLLLSLLLALPAACAAADGAQLAADKGCYNCHGEPARRNVPSFRAIVADYARYGPAADAATEEKLVDRMHDGGVFSHVAAHERLTEEEAHVLVRWLLRGG